MDIKFDSTSAQELIQNMNLFYQQIRVEAEKLNKITFQSGTWNDKQCEAFSNNLNALGNDLNKTFKLESTIVQTYSQRVKELEE